MTSRRKDKGKRLSVLTDAEKFALYGLPDFDEGQQLEYLSLTAEELALATSRPGILAQIYCILQTGYFKAKHAFFHFSPKDVESDFDFVVQRYFREISLTDKIITDHEYYAQRKLITDFFGYHQWSGAVGPQFDARAAQIVRRDITPGFVATELICWLNEKKIVRPGYSTLQKIISKALSTERQRLADILLSFLDTETQSALNSLLKKDDALSGLAVLKQEAKIFDGDKCPGKGRNETTWSRYIRRRDSCCLNSGSRNKICCTSPVWSIFIPFTICGTSEQSKPGYI